MTTTHQPLFHRPHGPLGFHLLSVVGFLALAACSEGDDNEAGVPTDAGPTTGGDARGNTAQTPPQGRVALDGWLSERHYQGWRCEAMTSAARPNSPHGRNRICANNLTSNHGTGEYPVGAAAVKELYGNDDKLDGIAVSMKVAAGTTGAAWYWYEKVNGAVVVDGIDVGLCTGCHSAAGKDSTHQGHDFVYLQVR